MAMSKELAEHLISKDNHPLRQQFISEQDQVEAELAEFFRDLDPKSFVESVQAVVEFNAFASLDGSDVIMKFIGMLALSRMTTAINRLTEEAHAQKSEAEGGEHD